MHPAEAKQQVMLLCNGWKTLVVQGFPRISYCAQLQLQDMSVVTEPSRSPQSEAQAHQMPLRQRISIYAVYRMQSYIECNCSKGRSSPFEGVFEFLCCIGDRCEQMRVSVHACKRLTEGWC